MESPVVTKNAMLRFLLQWADNSLILGHRLGEWCGHGPVLEQDIAMTNIALDLIGESRNIYQYAASIEGDKDENYYPYKRIERQFYNVKLVELPNKDFAYTVVRQFLFDTFHYYFLQDLVKNEDKTIGAIATRSLKEASYHLDFSSDWMKRLGDGTSLSHNKLQRACDEYWPYGEEFFMSVHLEGTELEESLGIDLNELKNKVASHRKMILDEATIYQPEVTHFYSGGKSGLHTEHLGYILSEMQYLVRTYPDAKW